MRKRKPVWMCEHPDTQLHLFLSHPSILTLKAVFFLPQHTPLYTPSFWPRLLNPSIFTHCCCHAHAGTLWCILPLRVPSTSLPLSILLCLSLSTRSLCIDSSEVPQLVESTVANAAKMTAGTPASLPFPPLPRHPSFLHAFFSSILTLGRCRSSYSPQQRRRPL